MNSLQYTWRLWLIYCIIHFNLINSNFTQVTPRHDSNGPAKYFGYPSRPILDAFADQEMQVRSNRENMQLFLRNPLPNFAMGLNEHVCAVLFNLNLY